LNVRPFDLMATVSTGPDRVRRGDEAGSVWSSARLALSSCSRKFNLKAPTGRCQLRCSRNGVLSNGRLAADETAVDPRGLRSSNTILFASSHAFSRRRGTRVASPRVADLPRREDRRCQYPGVRTIRPSVLCEALGAPSSCTLRVRRVVPGRRRVTARSFPTGGSHGWRRWRAPPRPAFPASPALADSPGA
jgi:hypothetical protein